MQSGGQLGGFIPFVVELDGRQAMLTHAAGGRASVEIDGQSQVVDWSRVLEANPVLAGSSVEAQAVAPGDVNRPSPTAPPAVSQSATRVPVARRGPDRSGQARESAQPPQTPGSESTVGSALGFAVGELARQREQQAADDLDPLSLFRGVTFRDPAANPYAGTDFDAELFGELPDKPTAPTAPTAEDIAGSELARGVPEADVANLVKMALGLTSDRPNSTADPSGITPGLAGRASAATNGTFSSMQAQAAMDVGRLPRRFDQDNQLPDLVAGLMAGLQGQREIARELKAQGLVDNAFGAYEAEMDLYERNLNAWFDMAEAREDVRAEWLDEMNMFSPDPIEHIEIAIDTIEQWSGSNKIELREAASWASIIATGQMSYDEAMANIASGTLGDRLDGLVDAGFSTDEALAQMVEQGLITSSQANEFPGIPEGSQISEDVIDFPDWVDDRVWSTESKKKEIIGNIDKLFGIHQGTGIDSLQLGYGTSWLELMTEEDARRLVEIYGIDKPGVVQADAD